MFCACRRAPGEVSFPLADARHALGGNSPRYAVRGSGSCRLQVFPCIWPAAALLTTGKFKGRKGEVPLAP